ncbi:MAG TPA: 4a-hydroxytetrahydrobiopterin dehydratase [Anaerolineales bacterium]|nr:4a-hydroxytetrahydrobiopterin dehydratase [Anaerolineales bacterium]
MPEYRKLEAADLQAALSDLEDWELIDGKLHREFKFKDFSAAFAFMTRAAMEAHRIDHHPEWSNVYNRVTVDLFTHETGGLTNLDVKLARKLNEFFS